jgi:EAL domain-containing protein (putative c-di-GMP-specific phosphodiesterase class I)
LSFGGEELEVEDGFSLHQAIENCLDSAFARTLAVADTLHGNRVDLPGGDIDAKGTSDIGDDGVSILELVNEAIENQRFVLLFQPIISLRGDSDEHYEVFLRMLDREGEQMAPGAFLRTAIDNDVAGKIDRWVILQSIKMLSTHRAKGNNTRLTINLTCNSVTDPDFTQWLGVAIKAARLPSDAVIFQVTEKDASTYIRQTREFFEKLKEMYCRASISRFRMTPDSFEVLNHIPAEFVKLDGTKIEDMGDDDEIGEAVTNTLRKLQAAGKLSIVPMVETANILSTLWQAGANYIQGHYLQEPSAEMDYDFSTDD